MRVVFAVTATVLIVMGTGAVAMFALARVSGDIDWLAVLFVGCESASGPVVNISWIWLLVQIGALAVQIVTVLRLGRPIALSWYLAGSVRLQRSRRARFAIAVFAGRAICILAHISLWFWGFSCDTLELGLLAVWLLLNPALGAIASTVSFRELTRQVSLSVGTLKEPTRAT